MANIHDCFRRAVQGGELKQDYADAMSRRFDQLKARYETIMPDHMAEAAARKDLRLATKADTEAKMHKTVAQLQSMRRLRDIIDGADDPAIALRQLLEYSEGTNFTGESVSSLQDAYTRIINAKIRDVLAETGQTIRGGSRNSARLKSLIRELHAEDTGDARAKELADAVRAAQEDMRQRFNAYGGDIGKLDDYGVHHSHDVAKLRKAGRETWKAEIALRLDWSRINDRATGQPFAAKKGEVPDKADTDRFLNEVYESITTRGWNTREPALSVGGKAMYNRRAEPRQLHFKSGSDWIDYNTEFGGADPFSSMIGGLHGMARDVALMRVLGPNPNMGLSFAEQVATKRAATLQDPDIEARVQSQAKLARAMLAHQDGSANMPANAAWAGFFGGLRSVLTSIQLGSALLSSTTDAVTISAASAMVGMNPANVLSRSAQLMSSNATRETAARMGYVADTLADAGSTAARFVGEQWVPEVANRLSQFTMRASGLAFWTDMNRTAFQMEFAGFLADNADRAFADIDVPLRQLFEQRGITAEDWDALRDPATRFTAPNGGDFITPFHWLETQTAMDRDAAEGLALRLQMAISEQLERAVPSVSLEGRARLQGATEPGTFYGELLRSGMMYKSFTLSFTLAQYRRIMAMPTPLSRAAYAASLSAGLIVMGGLAVQLKELAKGRDPRPMTEPKFWMAAVFQGGGLGIFGDFFSAETSRAGGGIAETLAGPVVGLGSDIIRPIASNVTRAVQGDDLLLGRDAANFVRYNTPVASSLWYARLGYDRLVADQLQRFLDPEADAAWRRAQRRAFNDYGTSQWWANGDLAPERWPDPSNAVRQP